jgi:hypothetical protein
MVWNTLAVGLAAGGIGSLISHVDLSLLVFFMGAAVGATLVAGVVVPIPDSTNDQTLATAHDSSKRAVKM